VISPEWIFSGQLCLEKFLDQLISTNHESSKLIGDLFSLPKNLTRRTLNLKERQLLHTEALPNGFSTE